MENYYDVQRLKVDDKLAIVVIFLKDHAINWWSIKNAQELEVVANLIWVVFKELVVESFMPKYEEFCEGINLVQMWHMGSLTVYIGNFNGPMNVTPKMHEFSRKYIVLGGVARIGSGRIVQVSKGSQKLGKDHENCRKH